MEKEIYPVTLPPKKPHPYPELEVLRQFDKSFEGKVPEEPLPITVQLYANYANVVKRLDKIWNEENQAQKGIAIRRMLDAAVQRLVELKDMLLDLELHEFHYVDGGYLQLRLVAKDFEILNLEGLPKERDPDLQALIDALIKRGERIYEPPPPEEEELGEEETIYEEVIEEESHKEEDVFSRRRKVPTTRESSTEDVEVERFRFVEPLDPKVEAMRNAVNLIQSHERGRQGRLEFHDALEIYKIRNKIKRIVKTPEEEGNPAATIIQKWYRGYIARRDLKKREERLRLMIGMYVPYWRSYEEQEKVKETAKVKRKIREEKAREYLDLIGRERERLARVVAPGLAEDIGDEIRYWFREWYDKACCFDKYPTPEQGGTIIVIRGETMTPEEYLEKVEANQKEKDKLKGNPAAAAKAKAAKAKAKKAAAAAKKKEQERLKREAKEAKRRKESGLEPWKFEESEALKQIEEAEGLYEKEWRIDMEPDQNPMRKTIMQPITDELMYALQLQVREEVDVLMELELRLLEKALAKDRRKKYRKPKKRKKKAKGKKVPKTIIDDRSVEDIFQELYDNGIIRSYPEVDLDDFIGDFNYANCEWRTRPGRPLDPLPATGDIKTVLVNTCVLPLVGGQGVPKSKSVCIAGPRQSGKKTLVYGICNATRAVLFDLTPNRLRGLYEEKQEKKVFILMINKLMRLLQPSIIFLDGAEKPFYKKVPRPERKDKPKKLKPLICKGLLKKLTPDDKVMLIATTRQPWGATPKPFIKTYEHIILLPRMDYGTTFMMWTKLLMQYKEIDRNTDISALTKVTQGYPIPVMRQIIDAILTPRRIIGMTRFNDRFSTKEIINYVVAGKGINPVTDVEQAQFTNWYNTKVPMGKKRTINLEEAEQTRIMEELQAAKAAKREKK